MVERGREGGRVVEGGERGREGAREREGGREGGRERREEAGGRETGGTAGEREKERGREGGRAGERESEGPPSLSPSLSPVSLLSLALPSLPLSLSRSPLLLSLQEIVHGGHAAFEQNINQKQYQTTFDIRECIFSHVRKKIRRPKEEGAGVTGYSNIVAKHETAGCRHDTADDDVEGNPPFELRVAIHGVGEDDRRHG